MAITSDYERVKRLPFVYMSGILMTLGEVIGEAAALCVKSGTTPSTLVVKALQKKLLAQGYFLGDKARLKQLGLV